jgi:uncharacterized protein YfaQ (DUF2300 family)
MRILETIASSLKAQSIHPTSVYNALISLENNAGIGALSDLEYRLSRLVRAMKDRQDPATGIASAWLLATRAYLEQYGQVEPIISPKIMRLEPQAPFLLSALNLPQALRPRPA